MGRRRALLLFLLAALAGGLVPGCTSDSYRLPPPSFPQPSWDEMAAACKSGTPIPEAGAYTGSAHFVVFEESDPYWFSSADWVPDDSLPDTGALSSAQHSTVRSVFTHNDPVQLVACRSVSPEKKYSCGDYARTDGVHGEVFLNALEDTIRIVVAQTGGTLESKVFTSATPDLSNCEQYYSSPAGTPPWGMRYHKVDRSAELDYVLSVATQPVTK